MSRWAPRAPTGNQEKIIYTWKKVKKKTRIYMKWDQREAQKNKKHEEKKKSKSRENMKKGWKIVKWKKSIDSSISHKKKKIQEETLLW